MVKLLTDLTIHFVTTTTTTILTAISNTNPIIATSNSLQTNPFNLHPVKKKYDN